MVLDSPQLVKGPSHYSPYLLLLFMETSFRHEQEACLLHSPRRPKLHADQEGKVLAAYLSTPVIVPEEQTNIA